MKDASKSQIITEYINRFFNYTAAEGTLGVAQLSLAEDPGEYFTAHLHILPTMRVCKDADMGPSSQAGEQTLEHNIALVCLLIVRYPFQRLPCYPFISASKLYSVATKGL